MKSEHRHELKTNELANWMVHFPEWAQKNARTLTAVAALIVVLAGGFIWNRYNQNVRNVGEHIRFSNLLAKVPQEKQAVLSAGSQNQDIAFRLTSIATELESYAEKSGNKTMAALAFLKSAETQRAELHFSFSQIAPGELNTRIASIQKSYERALEKATSDASIRSDARYGLGLCQEELGQFGEAEKIYREIVQDKTLAGTPGQAAAKYRLTVFQNYQEQIAFRPAPEPVIPDLPVVPELTQDANVPVVGPVMTVEPAPTEASDANTSEG